MIKFFLQTLRLSFDIDESKLRCLVHLHSYHNPDKQLNYWSKVSKIPSNQFYKPYFKTSTGKVKRLGYQGCLSVRYQDASLARELTIIYELFSDFAFQRGVR